MKIILSLFRLLQRIRSIATADELVRRYPEVFAKDLGTLPGTVHLRVDENAEPSVTPSRRIPIALKEKFKDELDRLKNLGVLAKVDEPTACVRSVVIATKKSGALRICIDPRPLNQALKRETQQLQQPQSAGIHPEEVSRVCAKTSSRYDDETSKI